MFSRPLRALALALATSVVLAGCGAPSTTQSPTTRQATSAAARQVKLDAPMVFIGGGKDQDDIMVKVMALAGGKDAPMVIVPLASGTPDQSGKAYVDYMHELGYPNASYVVPGTAAAADVNQVAKAKAVFFTGGDQSKILKSFGPEWIKALRAARAKGAVVAGTSAGAMVWGHLAIMGGDPLQTGMHGEDPAFGGIRMGEGFDFAPSLIVDTHFGERGRLPRLAYAVSKQAGATGIGVDPTTAAIVYPDGKLEVAGRGTVTVVNMPQQAAKGPMSLRDMRVHMLSAGDALSLNEQAR